MRRKWFKKVATMGLVAVMAVTGFAGCGSKSASGGKDDFTWWIYKIDGDGKYYEKYEENNVVQYINNQYWDAENGGIGSKDSGTKINLSFQVPIAGSESDNFNTMIATGEYPEIVDMSVSSDSPQSLNESGVAMDITEYVEKYMPNYISYLDANPGLKPLVTETDEDGKVHYYAIYSFSDGVEDAWQGSSYRRDWIVKYATPSAYVWDRDSEYVKTNGHPEVTPLAKAQSTGNLNGWKKNEVTSFVADYGENPDEDYTDNVIFPSGTSDPLTISDWEWMFEAFDKAIQERGWSDDTSSYATTIGYMGISGVGDLVSSFGGGTGMFYVDRNGQVSVDTDSDNLKTYVEAMSNWYKKGWLDSEFSSRTDMFFSINAAGVSQGKVGLWTGMLASLGTSIQASCENEEDAKDAFAMGCALPINDVYGTEAQMYKEPDALYQASRKGTATIVTNKAKDKDLASLFTYFDWTYTIEGARTIRFGLSQEQYDSMTFDPDVYGENGLTCAYTTSKDENGNPLYIKSVNQSDTLEGALFAIRMDIGIRTVTNGTGYTTDYGNPKVSVDAVKQWGLYENTGTTMDYTKLLSAEESTKYSAVNTEIMDYVSQNLPGVIKGTSDWNTYAQGAKKIDSTDVVKILQTYVDKENDAKGE